MDPAKVRSQLHRMREKTPPLVDRRGKAWVVATGSLNAQAEAAAAEAAAASPPAGGEGDVPQAPPVDPNAVEPF